MKNRPGFSTFRVPGRTKIRRKMVERLNDFSNAHVATIEAVNKSETVPGHTQQQVQVLQSPSPS